MGTMYYGGSEDPVEMPDRALAHLKVVIATKLRRGESFTVSWRHGEGEPRGRSTMWFHQSIPLRFVFDEPEPPALNREWLESLADSAHSAAGIQLVPESFGDLTIVTTTTPPAPDEAAAPKTADQSASSRRSSPSIAGPSSRTTEPSE